MAHSAKATEAKALNWKKAAPMRSRRNVPPGAAYQCSAPSSAIMSTEPTSQPAPRLARIPAAAMASPATRCSDRDHSRAPWTPNRAGMEWRRSPRSKSMSWSE